MSENALINELAKRREGAVLEVRTIDTIMRHIHEQPAELGTSRGDAMALRLIEQAVEAATGLSRERLLGACRERRFAMPRQLCMYLSKRLTCLSYPQIGRRWNRHHTTIIHAERAVADWKDADGALRDRLEGELRAAMTESAA